MLSHLLRLLSKKPIPVQPQRTVFLCVQTSCLLWWRTLKVTSTVSWSPHRSVCMTCQRMRIHLQRQALPSLLLGSIDLKVVSDQGFPALRLSCDTSSLIAHACHFIIHCLGQVSKDKRKTKKQTQGVPKKYQESVSQSFNIITITYLLVNSSWAFWWFGCKKTMMRWSEQHLASSVLFDVRTSQWHRDWHHVSSAMPS